MDSSQVPNVDLLTWTFDNEAVRDEDIIYIDSKDASRSLSKGSLRQLVRQLISGFKTITQEKPFVACVHSFNTLCYPALFLGIIGAGGQFTGSNPAYTAGELAHHLKISKSDFLFTQSASLEVGVQAANEAGIPPQRVFLFDEPQDLYNPTYQSWRVLLQYGEADWRRFDDVHTSATTTAILASTSGTTGLPKMAARSHRSFVAEHHAMIQEARKSYKVIRLLSVPFFHAFALPLALISAIRDGATTIIMSRFEKKQFLKLLSQYQVTETAVVPPLLLAFLSYSLEEKLPLSSLELAWCGGAPLDTNLQNRACQLFAPNARIVQVWGMTECGWISTFRYPENDNSGSVGRVLPGYEVKLVDDFGTTLHGQYQAGEILVKSPTVMQCYIGNEAATRETIDSEGWLRTGDVGKISNGKIYVIDRKKELIKVRGWQVAPAELEGVLLLHEYIADAAIIGISKPDSTSETPRAYVVRKDDAFLTEEDVKSFLIKHLAKYKVGDCEVRFTHSIPKSVSGKILRKLLRIEAEQEMKMLGVSQSQGQQARKDSAVGGFEEEKMIPTQQPPQNWFMFEKWLGLPRWLFNSFASILMMLMRSFRALGTHDRDI